MFYIIDTVAVLVGVIMAASVLLQLQRCVKRRHSDDVSMGMLALLVLGASTWLLYGIAHGLPSVIVANIVGVSCNIATLLVVRHYRGHKAPVPDEAPVAVPVTASL